MLSTTTALVCQVSLVTAHPKDKEKKDARGDPLEPGADLFDAFRPCYIRAYNDAKDISDDGGGKVGRLAQTATDDP